MKMPPLLAAASAVCLLAGPTFAAPKKVGQFDHNLDVGQVAFKGTAAYDRKRDSYRLTASGANIWGTADAFHYAARQASGDIRMAADIAFEGAGVDPHRKAGLMLRQSLAPDSPYVDVMVHGSGLVSLQYRETPGGETHEIASNVTGATRVELELSNGYAYLSVAGSDGVLHHAGGEFPLHFTGPYYAGLALSAHNNTITEAADFSRVEIAPATPFVPADTGYNAKVESTLEILDLGRFDRSVVYQTGDHIEAPNWTKDNHLLFNSAGHIYSIPAVGGTPSLIDTGGLHTLNNDHGLSPDGQWLAVSDQTSDDHQSRVYVLPATGGQPRQVTPQGPSYWHGWSPDGTTLTVIANRGGDFDVYAVPAQGGSETRLTTAPGLDDGADYSPDGQWIYFNSVRSGNMKIWRMHPDGSGQEQITFGDDSRDWFPHPSPDGKWIAFISFGTDVTVGDHPPNKDVMLKIMPTAGGDAKVVARLFGGQGTMNVPSWSPDSTRLAFVSYRLIP